MAPKERWPPVVVMLYAFLEDSTLEIVEDVVEARRRYEGIDVESDVVRFFDENGRRLKPNFTVPNRSGKYLGIIRWVESGVYDLCRIPIRPPTRLRSRSARPARWNRTDGSRALMRSGPP